VEGPAATSVISAFAESVFENWLSKDFYQESQNQVGNSNMQSDPIADLLTRIRNGYHARKASVDSPNSRIREEIVKILKSEGLVSDYEVVKETQFPTLRIHLRYDARRKPVLREINRISKPGLRIYKSAVELVPVRSGIGTQIVSTSQGLMTDREARKKKIGGEVICEVW